MFPRAGAPAGAEADEVVISSAFHFGEMWTEELSGGKCCVVMTEYFLGP